APWSMPPVAAMAPAAAVAPAAAWLALVCGTSTGARENQARDVAISSATCGPTRSKGMITHAMTLEPTGGTACSVSQNRPFIPRERTRRPPSGALNGSRAAALVGPQPGMFREPPEGALNGNRAAALVATLRARVLLVPLATRVLRIAATTDH